MATWYMLLRVIEHWLSWLWRSTRMLTAPSQKNNAPGEVSQKAMYNCPRRSWTAILPHRCQSYSLQWFVEKFNPNLCRSDAYLPMRVTLYDSASCVVLKADTSGSSLAFQIEAVYGVNAMLPQLCCYVR